jgi:hypothetical protein
LWIYGICKEVFAVNGSLVDRIDDWRKFTGFQFIVFHLRNCHGVLVIEILKVVEDLRVVYNDCLMFYKKNLPALCLESTERYGAGKEEGASKKMPCIGRDLRVHFQLFARAR